MRTHAETLARMFVIAAVVGSAAACSSAGGDPSGPGPVTGDAATDAPGSATDAPAGDSAPPTDGGADGSSIALPFQCAATSAPIAPNACPATSGAANEATFCYRPAWAGVTGVDVYGGFGKANDWQAPLLSLTNDGTGTFTGTIAVANGTYPYVFRVHGGADHVARDGAYMLDQQNPSFLPSPPGSPSYAANSKVPRSVSALTIPVVDAPTLHFKGTVLFKGTPQPCFPVDLEAGEVLLNGAAKQEHNTANFAESAADGTFDFTVTAAPYGIVVRYPFFLAAADAGYPDPSVTPSLGYARTGATLAADMTLDPIDVSYPDYPAMAPQGGSATLPVTFTFSVIPGSTAASVAVIGTSVAGNDPAYWGPYGTATSATWDGKFGGALGSAVLGTKYYWGTWQKFPATSDGGAAWAGESLLFPITFH